jgi:hypothetical protein
MGLPARQIAGEGITWARKAARRSGLFAGARETRARSTKADRVYAPHRGRVLRTHTKRACAFHPPAPIEPDPHPPSAPVSQVTA